MKLSWLTDTRGRIQRGLTTATSMVDKLQREVGDVAASRLMPDAKAEKITALQEPVLVAVRGIVNDTDAALALVKEQKPFWQSKEWVLSRAVFDGEDRAADATIKTERLAEFAAMSATTLQLTADAAVIDGDLAALHLALVVSQRHLGQPGWRGVDISRVVVPEQVAALAAIADCENLSVLVYEKWTLAQGAVQTPASKLTAARSQAALSQTSRSASANSLRS